MENRFLVRLKTHHVRTYWFIHDLTIITPVMEFNDASIIQLFILFTLTIVACYKPFTSIEKKNFIIVHFFAVDRSGESQLRQSWRRVAFVVQA